MAKKKSSLYDLNAPVAVDTPQSAAPQSDVDVASPPQSAIRNPQSAEPAVVDSNPQAALRNPQSASPIPTVVEVPSACPRCGARERDVTKTVKLPDRPMRLPTGELHLGMRLQHARCRKCNLRYNVKLPLPKKG